MAQTLDKFDVLLGSALTPEQRADVHDAWVAARSEAQLAYDDWCEAGRERRRDAYAVYRAAEQREAQAACSLQELACASAA